MQQLALFQKARNLPERKIQVVAYSGENLLLRALAAAFAISVLSYISIVGFSIMNMVSYREATQESERLQSIVSALEQNYFEISKSITPDLAARFNLDKPAATDFVMPANTVASNAQRTTF